MEVNSKYLSLNFRLKSFYIKTISWEPFGFNPPGPAYVVSLSLIPHQPLLLLFSEYKDITFKKFEKYSESNKNRNN